jgi:Zn-dependent protease with chaperone function
MRERLFPAVLLAFCPLLCSQQAPSINTPAPLSVDSVQAPSGPGPGFAFTKIDSDLLDEANAVDALYEKKGLVMHDPALQAFLDSVGKRVLANRTIPENVTFRFRAVRDPMVNAFALPNGSIYVTTGLLALLENEAQLAGILGHETSHVFERHTYLENRSVRKKALTINILEIAAAAAPAGNNLSAGVQLFGASVQLAAAIGSDIIVATIYGYSREMEHQADSDGLAAMTAASYDPSAMARSFELLDHDSSLEYEPIQGFYRDHPKLSDRRDFATQFASTHKAGTLVTGDPKTYLDNVSAAICYEIGADLSSRRERTAVDRAARLSAMFPDNPKYKVLLADSYRSLGAKTKAPTDEERTRHGQAEHRKEYFSMTPEEEQKKLGEKPEGQSALNDNQAMAEQLYKGVIQSNPNYAAAHSGLGFLFEQEGKYNEAASEYQTYLQMESGTSMDHLRIQRRLAVVQKLSGLTGQTH